ncbi:MAG: nucleotide exchange factor GrpE, partial [Anaerotignum sp.]|nr:nucleotide exchange factor GrpE [Anaerotignum sp.]
DQPFDPNFHNAVMQQETEGVEPSTVVNVFQKGYKMGDKIIRAATVVVSC